MNAVTSTRSTTRSGAPNGATTFASASRARLMARKSTCTRNPRGAAAEALSTLAEIEPKLDDDDHETQYWAALARYIVNWLGSCSEASLSSLEEAALRARLLGDRRRERGVFPFLVGAAHYGPASPEEMARLAAELEARGDAISSARRAAVAIRASIASHAGMETALRLLDGLIEEYRELGDETASSSTRASASRRSSELRACARPSP